MSSLSGFRKGIARGQGAPASSHQKATLEQRVLGLEGLVGQLMRALTDFQNKLATLEALGVAITEVVGSENVISANQKIQIASVEEESAAFDLRLKDSVSKGELAPEEAVTENSVVVYEDRGDDGVQRHPYRIHSSVAELPEDLKNALVGAKVGDEIFVTGRGMNINILEIYGAAAIPATSGLVDTSESGGESS